MKIVNLTTRKEMSKALARRYKRAKKKEKTEILNVFVKMTGYHRVYASWLLRNWGRKIEIRGRENDYRRATTEFLAFSRPTPPLHYDLVVLESQNHP